MKVLVHQLIESTARLHADATALVFKDQTISYGALWDQVTLTAGGLQRLGLERGDRVAVYLEKRIENAMALFGVAAAAGVFVPVNPMLRARQVAYILRDCGVRVLVTSPERLSSIAPELHECVDLRVIVLVGGSATSDALPGIRTVAWKDLADGSERSVAPSIDADIAAILYTSGSTGNPKGVVLSHRNIVSGAESVSHYLGNVPEDRILSLLPLSFDAGLSQLTTAFNVGSTVVLMNFLLARDVVRVCEKQCITGLTCVPPLYIKLANENWPEQASARIRYFANTGGHMPGPLLGRLRATFPHAKPFLMYGLTEAFRSTYLDPDQIDRRPESMGKAVPNAEIRVVRKNGEDCEPGEIGELVHRGALVSMGYWNRPELTAERFRPAPGQPVDTPFPEIAVWSGDLVKKDEDGFLYFVGRNDDMIKTSGYRVSPTEVEEVVFRTGLVSEVAAIGVVDDELGQAIVIVVTPAAGHELDADGILQECRRQLPQYMVPQEIRERVSLPRTPNGKIDRKRIQQEWVDHARKDTDE